MVDDNILGCVIFAIVNFSIFGVCSLERNGKNRR